MHISKQDAESIVKEMKAAIGRDINIMDETGRIVASTNPSREGRMHSGAERLLKEGLDRLDIFEDDPASGVQQGVNQPIYIGGNLEGVIGITGDPAEVGVFGEVIRRMTEILIDSVQKQARELEEERARGIFIENLLFGEEPDWASLETRGRLLGIPIRDPYTLVILQNRSEDPEQDLSVLHSGQLLRSIERQLKGEKSSVGVMVRSRVILLLHKTGRQKAYNLTVEICNDLRSRYGLSMSAGISSASSSAEDIRRCYQEARTANTIAQRSSKNHIVFYDQVSLEFVADSIPPAIRKGLHNLVFSGCTEKEKELFTETIRLYFELDGDISACAQKLYLHRNSFAYRMRQLEKRTGCSLTIPKDSLLLYLAVC